MTRIYSAYQREREVRPGSAVLVIHPPSTIAVTAQPGWDRAAATLVEEARAQGLPVIHSIPTGAAPAAGVQPKPGELVCGRPCESAFFFSELEAILKRTRAQGVVICGAPMSGSVRATAVDAKSFGHKTAIAEEATGDEATMLRKIALFDVAHKYADVMSLDELLAGLRTSSNTR
jgi:nicotinamidase-related amidase